MLRAIKSIPLAIFAVSPATGQITPPVQNGDQVRFWAQDLGHTKTRATLRSWYDSTVAFILVDDQQDAVVPFPHLTKLEVLTGKDRWRGAGMGAAIGGLAGGLLGMLIGNSAVEDCTEFMCEMSAIGYAGVGMLIGIGVGVPIGVEAAPDKWKRVDLPTEMGFPPYAQPWHKTTAFKIFTGVAGALLLIAMSSGS